MCDPYATLRASKCNVIYKTGKYLSQRKRETRTGISYQLPAASD